MAEVSRECGLEVVVDDYVETFKPFLMDIMYSWSKGASFRDICLMTGERRETGGTEIGGEAISRVWRWSKGAASLRHICLMTAGPSKGGLAG